MCGDRCQIKCLRRIRQGSDGPFNNVGEDLLSYYVVTARERALQTGAVPKHSIDDRTMRGIRPCEENLKTVARPFRSTAPLAGRAENGAALRSQFVEEESSCQTHGVNGSSSGSREVIGRDKQQV